jgi:thioredoxin reductase (NADPH)
VTAGPDSGAADAPPQDGREVNDLVIIGAGAAGLTCAIYAGRGRLSTLVLEKMLPGGQIVLNDVIENYPGFPEGISGFELAQQMAQQAKRFGARIETGTVESMGIARRPFEVHLTGGEAIQARALLIATGCSPRKLGVPGEKEFAARGVSYCATCDGPLFSGKPLLVVGGGNTAIDEALFLANVASKVTVVHRRDELRADAILQERAFATEKIEFLWSHVLTEIVGEESVHAARARHVETGEDAEISVSGVFIAVGETPQAAFVPHEIARDEHGYILTDEDLQTSVPGVFCAGDVRSGAYRQIAAAVGEGVLAYRSIRTYLEASE